jgi:hypothetical protein
MEKILLFRFLYDILTMYSLSKQRIMIPLEFETGYHII